MPFNPFRIAVLAVAVFGFGWIPLEARPASLTAANATPAGPQAGPPSHDQAHEPKAIPIQGTDLELIVGGYVKVDFIQDLDAIGDRYEFKSNAIRVGDPATAPSGQTTIHARETRVNLELRSVQQGRPPFRTFVEGDFFGDNNAFRLRHGYGEFGTILGGQTWSTFQDISARPLTVDFEGSDGEVFVRQAMIRLRKRIGDVAVAVAVENATTQFAVPSGIAGGPRSLMPDIPFYLRYQWARGHLQAAGLIRQLRFDSTGDLADATDVGMGANVSAVFRVAGRDQAQAQFVYGHGIARYVESLSGQNLDAVVSSSGSIASLRAGGATLGYTHFWRSDLRSGVSISSGAVETTDRLAPSALASTRDMRANLFWTPYRPVDIAGEVLWGRRQNQDGSAGEAWRLQFALIFRIN